MLNWMKPQKNNMKEDLVGKRVRLDYMPDDPNPIKTGTEGTIIHVDDLGQLVMKWDDGRSLSLIPGVDKYTIL